MCTPSVAFLPQDVNGPRVFGMADKPSRWPRPSTDAWRHDARHCGCPMPLLPRTAFNEPETGRSLAPRMVRVEPLSGLPSGVDSVELCLSAGGPRARHICTRRTARQPGLILPEHVRNRIRRDLLRSESCGTSFRSLTRVEARGKIDREYRTVVPVLCGCRIHRECDERARREQCARMMGPWRLMITLTYSHTGRDIITDSVAFHGWIRRLTDALRRSANHDNFGPVKMPAARIREHEDILTKPKTTKRKEALLQYAWAIENHKSGFPHLHLCVSARFVELKWLRKIWSEITGARTSNIDIKKVYSIEGACRYLSTYVSKGGITPDLLGVWRRRRLWASTLQRPKSAEAQWIPEPTLPQADLKAAVKRPREWAARAGWTYEHGRKGVYAQWYRDVPTGTRMPRELDEWEAGELLAAGNAREFGREIRD